MQADLCRALSKFSYDSLNLIKQIIWNYKAIASKQKLLQFLVRKLNSLHAGKV